MRVLLTRNSDTNLSLRDRARIAADQRAEVFLSIHFNGFNGNARGSETWIQSVANGNLNYIADEAFARRVQSAVFGTLSRHDANARNRGIKEDKVLSVITDPYLGNSVTAATCRACLAEIEFIDVPAVDTLLNTGATANVVRAELAAALKTAILGELQVAVAVRSLQPARTKKRTKKRAKKKKRVSARRRRP